MQSYYYKNSHTRLPHIVKFSGGRSSGYMLFKMLENGMLKKERGDFVIFNNTSAEHSKTYKFVAKCKERCEKEFGIPFFIIEFQTYEDAKNGIYDRFSSYRLVNSKPYSKKNPNGYRYKGEVFEELLSKMIMVPNKFGGRFCTKNLKMLTSENFILDWLLGYNKIERLGHYGEVSRIDKELIYKKHIKNNGGVPKDIYFKKKEFVYSCPLFRAEQFYQDYTSVDLGYRKKIKTKEYLTFVGFRFDEIERIVKMQKRIENSGKNEKDAQYNNEVLQNQFFGYLKDGNEHIYTPMIRYKITKNHIREFWESMDFDLGLPYDGTLGNCVYCFMKGSKKLLSIPSNSKVNTPENIDWWIKMEQKYQRDLKAEGRITKKESVKFINFFGESNQMSYEKIKNKDEIDFSNDEALPCNCTD